MRKCPFENKGPIMSFKSIIPATAVALALMAVPETAQATDKYIGEIFAVGFSFCPRGTAKLDGQLLPISSNAALFSLLGTQFGGDGRTSFGLPDMRGRSMLHPGSGRGLSTFRIGQRGGTETHTMTVAEMPSHYHGLHNAEGGSSSIGGTGAGDTENKEPVATSSEGGSQSFNIRDPYVVVNHCIVLQGVYPSRN